jgi:hypothetical protein
MDNGRNGRLKTAAFLPLAPSLPAKFRYKAGSPKARGDLSNLPHAL